VFFLFFLIVLLFYRKYDTVMVVDDSGSMRGALWAKYDHDGIDIHFLNDSRVGSNIRVSFLLYIILHLAWGWVSIPVMSSMTVNWQASFGF